MRTIQAEQTARRKKTTRAADTRKREEGPAAGSAAVKDAVKQSPAAGKGLPSANGGAAAGGAKPLSKLVERLKTKKATKDEGKRP